MTELPEGYRVVIFDEVGSTNTLALEMAREGEASGLWVMGRRQLAGKGRQGRAWMSEKGNLYVSLLLRNPAPMSRLGNLPLVVALAVHDAIADVLPPFARAPLEIKWPNDILYDGAKICGILIEGAHQAEGQVVVIGIGINCRHHPEGTPYPAADLAGLGYPVEPDDLLPVLAARMKQRLDAWRDGSFAPLREAWLARARGVGETITVRMPNGTREGVFDGLDADGRLLLRAGGQVEAISAGDVFFGGMGGKAGR
ncbi:biotin--[acetyl-CoA-carboxylase] ligase [Oryzibacter oryziterrae]|uniref:biotin--[acetyl-CoA-carboxylase] ligase n=1 Tax=Oryzibacter oryziterrae TaxID=2766474 RepID=UPI001F0075FB|nr:biotin--[acetyl-CoA-carboxylase] ligase [Oryzibacter oryziterrae]